MVSYRFLEGAQVCAADASVIYHIKLVIFSPIILGCSLGTERQKSCYSPSFTLLQSVSETFSPHSLQRHLSPFIYWIITSFLVVDCWELGFSYKSSNLFFGGGTWQVKVIVIPFVVVILILTHLSPLDPSISYNLLSKVSNYRLCIYSCTPLSLQKNLNPPNVVYQVCSVFILSFFSYRHVGSWRNPSWAFHSVSYFSWWKVIFIILSLLPLAFVFLSYHCPSFLLVR